MLAAPPGDAPYHRLARTSRHRWWRPIVELVLALALWFGLAFVALLIVMSFVDIQQPEDLLRLEGAWGLIVVASSLATMIPASILAAVFCGRAPGALASVRGRVRWRWLGRCVLVALVVYVVYVGVVLGLSALGVEWGGAPELRWPGWDEFLPLAAVVVLAIPLQATGEELFFRGTVMQAVGAWVASPWPAIVVSSVVFAAAHGLSIEGFVAITGFGAVTAWLAYRTGGLEAAIAFHVVNNVIGLLLVAASGGGGTWISELNAGITWIDALSDLIVQAVFAGVVVRAARRRGIEPRSV
jgi:membrane protease YdiL (CAAX protease family)